MTPGLAGAYAGWAGSVPPEVDRRLRQSLDMADLPADQFADAVPTLLLYGDQDVWASPSVAEAALCLQRPDPAATDWCDGAHEAGVDGLRGVR